MEARKTLQSSLTTSRRFVDNRSACSVIFVAGEWARTVDVTVDQMSSIITRDDYNRVAVVRGSFPFLVLPFSPALSFPRNRNAKSCRLVPSNRISKIENSIGTCES